MIRSLTPDAWLEAYALAAPHARFCGHVAKRQAVNGRFFLNEQPHPSDVYFEAPWEEIISTPVLEIVSDQCRAGLKTKSGGFIKKPTKLISNTEELLRAFVGLVCRGTHEHVVLEGSSLTSAAQVWTWDKCRRIICGMEVLKRKRLKSIAAHVTVSIGANLWQRLATWARD